MIRFRRITLHPLQTWMTPQPGAGVKGRYELRVWREVNANLAGVRDELLAYVQEALDDARSRLRKGFEDPLSPFSDPAEDPAANYPAMLNRITLQGYLGETFAGLFVEHFGAFGATDWLVPAFLFRFHDTEFQHLDLINERLARGDTHDRDAVKERRPGRTGDDALAFRLDANGRITHVLSLEAKCLAANHPETISDAHAKLSVPREKPSGVRELINLLQEYDTPEAQAWQEKLLVFYRDGFRTAEQSNGLAYTVGHWPLSPKTRLSWLDADAPHASYTSNRKLEVMEVQLSDLKGLVDTLYRDA